MIRATRALAILTTMVMLTGAPLAQSGGGTASDPITGVWTGSIGPGTTPGFGVTMTLKFDGKAAVTGTAQASNGGDTAVVKTGTFDPQTGALKLVLSLGDGSETVTFDGTLVLDTAAGRVNISSQQEPGTFLLRRGSTGSGKTTAQAPESVAALRSGFEELSGWILKSAELVPAEKYTYQPVKTVRTFGQLIAHIVDGQNYYCARASGQKVEWQDVTEKGKTDKATVLPKLKQSMQTCAALYGTSSAPPLMANIGHGSLHYGNIVTYMRMLGLVPPSS